MPDANDLVKAMKRAALDAIEANKPANVYFGNVVSVEPLQINVEQKMMLGRAQLILSRNVTDFKMTVTFGGETESVLSSHEHTLSKNTEKGGADLHEHALSGNTGSANLEHTHKISGRKEITVHNALAAGDNVILVRQQNGQKYIVIDRIGVM